VLDDVADFDSGKVQEAEYWLIDNVLPPADIKLPESWNTGCYDVTGYCDMDWDHISEADAKIYRGVSAFFVMRDGKKMLRLGVEYGGPGQLIHFNFEDPKWWTDPVRVKTLIAAFNHTDVLIKPVTQCGTSNLNGLTPRNGYLAYSDQSSAESYTKKVAAERQPGLDNWFGKYWMDNRKLPEGADKTILGPSFFVIVK
jgi:hypothetical protein